VRSPRRSDQGAQAFQFPEDRVQSALAPFEVCLDLAEVRLQGGVIRCVELGDNRLELLDAGVQ